MRKKCFAKLFIKEHKNTSGIQDVVVLLMADKKKKGKGPGCHCHGCLFLIAEK